MSHVESLRTRLSSRQQPPNPQQYCPLIQLPGEILNKIYGFMAEPSPGPIRLRYRYPEPDDPLLRRLISYSSARAQHGVTKDVYRHIAMLQTCQWIYTEILPLVYQWNRFYWTISSEEDLLPRRTVTEPGISLITNLRIDLSFSDADVQRDFVAITENKVARIAALMATHHEWDFLADMALLTSLQVVVRFSCPILPYDLSLSELFIAYWDRAFPYWCHRLINLVEHIPPALRHSVVWGPRDGELGPTTIGNAEYLPVERRQLVEIIVKEIREKRRLPRFPARGLHPNWQWEKAVYPDEDRDLNDLMLHHELFAMQ